VYKCTDLNKFAFALQLGQLLFPSLQQGNEREDLVERRYVCTCTTWTTSASATGSLAQCKFDCKHSLVVRGKCFAGEVYTWV
jgi:hypothetical protein